jgi:hypothetical protein
MSEQVSPAANLPAQGEAPAPGSLEEYAQDAAAWLDTVGAANHRGDGHEGNAFTEGRDEVLRYFGDKFAESDGQTILLLGGLEQEARRRVQEEGVGDQVAERQARDSQFNLLANAMLEFRGHAPALPAETPPAAETGSPPQ